MLTVDGQKPAPVNLSQLFKADLLTFWFVPFWSIFSRGPKRLTFYSQVLWASELL